MGHFNWYCRPQAWEALKTFLSNFFPAIKRVIAKPKTFPIISEVNFLSIITVIERRQQQLGRMADFPPPVTFSVFDL